MHTSIQDSPRSTRSDRHDRSVLYKLNSTRARLLVTNNEKVVYIFNDAK